MVEDEKGVFNIKSGRYGSFSVRICAAVFSSFVGLILMYVTMLVVSFFLFILTEILFPSGEAPAAVAVGTGIISFVVGLGILITSTVKIFAFLKKNLDFDVFGSKG